VYLILKKGIIISIQGYHYKTISELAEDAIAAGAVGIRTDKKPFSNVRYPLIGLQKLTIKDPESEAYITPNIEEIKRVSPWAGFVAIDCRRLNEDLDTVLLFCAQNDIEVVADIQNMEDYKNLKEKNHKFAFVATTFSIFNPGNKFSPDLDFIKELCDAGEKNIIAEGHYQTREQVREAFKSGANNICIGGAVANVYKLTRKFTTAIL
jgi:putative N-acetylmannosamine-6-phosphate epimerase